MVWNEVLYFGERLPTTLVNPNQVRAGGHIVEECQQQFDKRSSHSITTSCGIRIPLELEGVMSCFPMRKLTDSEVRDCPRIEMTSEMPWNPHSKKIQEAENSAGRGSGMTLQLSDWIIIERNTL